jgi:hypothetical protein
LNKYFRPRQQHQHSCSSMIVTTPQAVEIGNENATKLE